MTTNKVLVNELAIKSMVQDAWSIDIPVSAKRVALALKVAKMEGDEFYQYALACALQRRRERLSYETLLQRKWQTKVSRRPQRGRHHDSWAIRERNVTGKS